MNPRDDQPDERLLNRRQILASSAGLAATGLAGCSSGDSTPTEGDDSTPGDDATPTATPMETVDIHQVLLEGSMYVPVLYYGRTEDLFAQRGLNMSFEVSGFGKFTRTFTNNLSTGLSTLSALPLLEQAATDTPVKIFGQTMNFINQCFVQADSDIEDPTDLEGMTLGVPFAGSSTTRSYIALWAEQYDFDLMNDTAEIVDTSPASLFSLLQDGEIDAAILFTSFTIAALADENMRSIYNPTPAWIEQTGFPPAVNLWGVYEDFLNEHPQKVLQFQDAWWEAIDLFRNNYQDAMNQFAALGGLGAEDEAELEVVRQMAVEDQQLFNKEWNDDWVDANIQLGEAVLAQGGIEAAPGRDAFVTREDIEGMM